MVLLTEKLLVTVVCDHATPAVAMIAASSVIFLIQRPDVKGRKFILSFETHY
jgi:hypothetical protein